MTNPVPVEEYVDIFSGIQSLGGKLKLFNSFEKGLFTSFLSRGL